MTKGRAPVRECLSQTSVSADGATVLEAADPPLVPRPHKAPAIKRVLERAS